MPYIARPNAQRRQPRRRKLLIIPLLVLIGIGVWFVLGHRTAEAPDPSPSAQEQPESQQAEIPKPAPIDLQPTIDTWLAGKSADYGIAVYDVANKKTIASNIPDQKFFAASLYKMFVAYLALLDIQNGDINPEETLTQGFTWKECIDKMIRESHSPCGEAAMAEIGQKTLETRVKAMGINNTTFAGIQTSAQDSALILQYLVEKRDLNTENTAVLRDAMLTQEAKFKRGLQTGAPDAKWETKVGWNETSNYHDIGIMTMPDGREYIVAILSEGQGSPAPIADFAKTIFSKLSE